MSILSILLLISLSLLNTSNKLMICAALFVGATLVVNSMVEFYGRSKATYSLIVCTVICCLFKLQNFSFMIYDNGSIYCNFNLSSLKHSCF